VKVTYIGHAAILIEAAGVRLLSDPWWQGPCFGNQWWIYPRPHLQALNGHPIDYIYISHAHSDHFHRGTLRRFPIGTKVLVSNELTLGYELRGMGFDVVEVSRDEPVELTGGLMCRIIPTHAGDTLMVVQDRDEVCINANDSLHPAPELIQNKITTRLRKLYPRIDYLFCAYGTASHFPNCYIVPGKDYERTAKHRQHYFNNQWARLVSLLEPRFAFPFAADVVFLDPDLFWTNEIVRNAERPVSVFTSRYPKAATEAIDIAPGFAIADGAIAENRRFQPIRAAEVCAAYEKAVAKAKAPPVRNAEGADTLKEGLERNLAICRSRLLEYPASYRFLVLLRDRSWALEVSKKRAELTAAVIDADSIQRVDYDVILTSHYSYLRRSLTRAYGNEILFVGSGCLIEYRERERIAENLHEELTTLIAHYEHPPRSRFGDQPKWVFRLKSGIKTALVHKEVDLYDLKAWTLFEDHSGRMRP